MNNLLANIVFILHVFVILFFIYAPFSNCIEILIIHILFSIGLVVHWITNSNICFLSVLEGYFRNINYNNTFTHQFISPFYDIPENVWNKIIYIITFCLFSTSIFNLIIKIKKLKQPLE